MTPPSILIVYAHPAPHASRVNRMLAQAARALPQVEVHDLYEHYPDFFIDVPSEQARLAAAGHVVFVHPIQWYSMPALLKEWVDVVLQPGWAYGKDGKALAGKTYWLVTTTGSGPDAYSADGPHGRPFDDYLPQFRQTAALCGMRWKEALVLHGAHLVDDAAVEAHVATFIAGLEHLSTLTTG